MYQLSTIKRVVAWNEARYPQQLNNDLQQSLLVEELKELEDAIFKKPTEETLIEKLDACGDVAFVAIGGLWKFGFSAEQIFAILQQQNSVKHNDGVNLPPLPEIIHLLRKEYVPGVCEINIIQICVIADETGMYDDTLNIICTSNETKAIKKTDPSVKANVDKGQAFVPPTEDLKALIQKARDLRVFVGKMVPPKHLKD